MSPGDVAMLSREAMQNLAPPHVDPIRDPKQRLDAFFWLVASFHDKAGDVRETCASRSSDKARRAKLSALGAMSARRVGEMSWLRCCVGVKSDGIRKKSFVCPDLWNP